MLYFVMHRFDKIINKEIPSTVVYEDDKVLHDVWLQIVDAVFGVFLKNLIYISVVKTLQI